MVRNFEKQVRSDHYRFDRYIRKPRWNSLYHQISEIMACRPDSVLEVGVGAGIVAAILRTFDIAYESIDIDPELRPDHTGSVLDMPIPGKSYDVVGCFQVLEHLPYDSFRLALRELFRVARVSVVISLPDARPVWPYSALIPKMGHFRWLFPRPMARLPQHTFDGEHHWEVNTRRYPLKVVRGDIINSARSAGFSLIKNYRVWENPYHRFFVLRAQEHQTDT